LPAGAQYCVGAKVHERVSNGVKASASCTPPRRTRSEIALTFGAVGLPVLVFLSLYAWRPLRFGFYSDDWEVVLHPEPGSASSFADLLSLFGSRPVSALTAWIAESVIDWVPARAQIVNVMLTAAAASAVSWLTWSLAGSVSASRSARLWGAGL